MNKKSFSIAVILIVAVATAAVLWVLDSIDDRKEEARQTVFKIVNLTEQMADPAEWGKNFPRQYDSYQRASELTGTKYGGGGSDRQSINLRRIPG
jgi:nitrite reductase (cytochrome c-552)